MSFIEDIRAITDKIIEDKKKKDEQTLAEEWERIKSLILTAANEGSGQEYTIISSNIQYRSYLRLKEEGFEIESIDYDNEGNADKYKINWCR